MKRILFAFGVLGLGSIALPTPSLADPVRGATVMCYLWANNASPPLDTPYEPSSYYSFNAQNRAGGITVSKTATGTYSVTCPGVGGGTPSDPGGHAQVTHPGGHVQVSAYGDGVSTFCNVGRWSTSGADFTASVDCFGPGEGRGEGPAPKDSRFDLLFVW